MPLMVGKMRAMGATVTVHGDAWDHAHIRAVNIGLSRGWDDVMRGPLTAAQAACTYPRSIIR